MKTTLRGWWVVVVGVGCVVLVGVCGLVVGGYLTRDSVERTKEPPQDSGIDVTVGRGKVEGSSTTLVVTAVTPDEELAQAAVLEIESRVAEIIQLEYGSSIHNVSTSEDAHRAAGECEWHAAFPKVTRGQSGSGPVTWTATIAAVSNDGVIAEKYKLVLRQAFIEARLQLNGPVVSINLKINE